MTDYSDTVGDYLGPTPAQDASYGTFKGGVQKAQADHEAQLSRRAATPYGQFLDMLGTGMSVLPASPIARVGQMAPRAPSVPPPAGREYVQPAPVRGIPSRGDPVQHMADDARDIRVTDPKQLAGQYQRISNENAGEAAAKMSEQNSPNMPKQWGDAIGILQQRQQTVQDLFRRGLISAAQYQKLRGGK